jgi:hypothetical protein
MIVKDERIRLSLRQKGSRPARDFIAYNKAGKH